MGAGMLLGKADATQDPVLLGTCTVAGTTTATVQIDGADTVNTALLVDGVALAVGDRCVLERQGSLLLATHSFTDQPRTALTTTGVSGGTAIWQAKGGWVEVEVSVSSLTASLANAASLTFVTAANGIPARYRRAASIWTGLARSTPLGAPVTIFSGSDGSLAVNNATGVAITAFQFTFSYPMVP